MIKIIHRVNDVQDLNKLSVNFGVEIDIRANNGALILSHDLNQKNSSNLNDYLDVYNHQFLVANIKESGIEEEVINALETKNISNYFLLDVEFPFLLQNGNMVAVVPHGIFNTFLFSRLFVLGRVHCSGSCIPGSLINL